MSYARVLNFALVAAALMKEKVKIPPVWEILLDDPIVLHTRTDIPVEFPSGSLAVLLTIHVDANERDVNLLIKWLKTLKLIKPFVPNVEFAFPSESFIIGISKSPSFACFMGNLDGISILGPKVG